MFCSLYDSNRYGRAWGGPFPPNSRLSWPRRAEIDTNRSSELHELTKGRGVEDRAVAGVEPAVPVRVRLLRRQVRWRGFRDEVVVVQSLLD